MNTKEKKELENFATTQLKKWGLTHVELQWTNAFYLGRAKTEYRKLYNNEVEIISQTLLLSKRGVRIYGMEEAKDTILHEIAHLLAPLDEGHGREWQRLARMVGAKPERLHFSSKEEREMVNREKKYRATCRNCGNSYYFNRMGKKWANNRYRCGKCRGEFDIVQQR